MRGLQGLGTNEWLDGMTLAMQQAIQDEVGYGDLVVRMVIRRHGKEYIVLSKKDGAPFKAINRFTLYICQLPSGQFGLLKLTPERYPSEQGWNQGEKLTDAHRLACNEALQYEAVLLRSLHAKAVALNDPTDPLRSYNYQHFFPHVEEAFESDGRYAQIIGYTAEVIKAQSQLISVGRIIDPDGQGQQRRVHAKDVVWIASRLFKLAGFLQLDDINVHVQINMANVLIEPAAHGAILFDWSQAREGAKPKKAIRSIGRCLWLLAGGTQTDDPPEDDFTDSKQALEFRMWLDRLIEGSIGSPLEEQRQMYAMAESFWGPRRFHAFEVFEL
ncbi:hypothetical protein C5B42_00595 [Candidatus Cerribacteria bacterium 'Amazon FNV 2010 28 9']|uniref:Protein kinase domain-containing protein n=1 Tax=Candidatus Cerribacteria bacterium 'Amazon FNV 2010 28 9' TaxID=2081795 RepID=A0A317JPW7_9BACT|nr:MAG: hypothetical protein C5B42_00595 [Candidatus Cerribacteria bacterium 'Amazon FNV 2010 28 9']